MSARVLRLVIACALVLAPSSGAPQTAGTSFDSDGVQIHYADKGQGQPVVLLHGATGSYQRHWEAPGVIEALEKAGYRVIAMDCRGHGQSGKPRDPDRYGFEMVNDVLRFLDHLKIERAHVVGYSMGGTIAMQLLLKHPARVMTATLLGSGWEGEDLQTFRSQIEALAEGFARKDASLLIRAVMSSAEKEPTPEEVAALNASMFARNDPEVLAAVFRGIVPLFEVPADRLRTIKRPVLAIVGTDDTRNVDGVKRMVGIVPRLEVVELPGANHATSVRPSATHIVAFLDKQRQN